MASVNLALLFGNLATNVAQTATRVQEVKGQADLQRSALDFNRRQTLAQAEDVKKRGELAEARHRLATARLIGTQQAAAAAAGVNVASGSAGAIQEETAAMGSLDALMIRQNARRAAYGLEQQAIEYGSQKKLVGIAAKNATRSTFLTGGLSALRNVGYYDYMRELEAKGKTIPPPTMYGGPSFSPGYE